MQEARNVIHQARRPAPSDREVKQEHELIDRNRSSAHGGGRVTGLPPDLAAQLQRMGMGDGTTWMDGGTTYMIPAGQGAGVAQNLT